TGMEGLVHQPLRHRSARGCHLPGSGRLRLTYRPGAPTMADNTARHLPKESSMKVGVIIGSIRKGRFGQGVGDWVMGQVEALADEGVEYALLDLKAFNVPLLEAETVPGAANKQYEDENVTRWSQAIDACDAFLFITPEYNH